MSLIVLVIGLAVCFNGYRWFLVLLPILGFFWGFGLGTQTLQALFGIGFVSTVSSWIVGFIVGLIFAVLSYLFYVVGVAIMAGSFGYSLGVGFMGLIGLDLGIISWIVGVVVGVIAAIATLALNIQKWVIIALTSLGGAGVIIGTMLMALGRIDPSDLGKNAVGAAIQNSWLWMLFFIVLGGLGFVSQVVTTRDYVLEAPENRI
jgi:hypothetical protein